MKPDHTSAGLLLFRRSAGLELFLAHPGGPFWQRRDTGARTIPKGLTEPGEEPLAAAGCPPGGGGLTSGPPEAEMRNVVVVA